MQTSPPQPPRLSDALSHGVADKRIDILRAIARTGSISQAARDVAVSYKAAWQAVDTLTNLAGVPLVERAVGGVGGGGAEGWSAAVSQAVKDNRSWRVMQRAGPAGCRGAMGTTGRGVGNSTGSGRGGVACTWGGSASSQRMS